MRNAPRQIAADDFDVGNKLMISKSRRKQVADGQISVDFMLQGAVIEIMSINLPFVLVSAICPMRGQQDLVLDIRDHEFIRVNPEFAEAVEASAAKLVTPCDHNDLRESSAISE